MFQPLLTKLSVPQANNPAQVQRSHLLSLLNQGLKTARLILVSAQAGAGKTTLLGQWAATSTGLEIIWLTLDKADNDPTRFWSYVVAAFKDRLPGLSETGQQLLDMLQTPPLVAQPVPVEIILTELINAILHQPSASSQALCLVLDDYHLVENAQIHRALAGFLDFLPPNLHLIIASRSDPQLPLARLRARGQLLEVRAEDLRFNLTEVATFYNDNMQLGLLPQQITTLEKRTEGWAAGMQLLALSLQGLMGTKREEFIRSFSGTNRYIIDYLAQEILETLPETTQKFLLQTSILEKLNGALCEAVVEPEKDLDEQGQQAALNQPGQAILESLASQNLFVSRVDEQGEWFRYHPLFGAVLNNRLNRVYGASFRQTLHLRAAGWFKSQGWPTEAVKHYFAAQEFTGAAELLANSLGEWWQKGELLSLVGWIEQLPLPVRAQFPLLEITRAWPVVLTGQVDRISEILNNLTNHLQNLEPLAIERPAAALFETQEHSAILQAQVNFLKGFVAVSSSNWGQAISYFEAALPYLPQKPGPGKVLPWWLLTLTSLGWAYRFTGHPHHAREAYDRAIALCRANQDLAALVGATGYRTELEEEAGQLRLAARIYREIIQEGEEKLGSGLPRLYMSGLYAGLGRVYYRWNDLVQAETNLNRALSYSRLDQNLPVIIQALEGLAKIALAQGDYARAFELLSEMQAEAVRPHLDELRQHLRALEVQFQLRRGQLAVAAEWAKDLLGRNPDYLKLPPAHLREIRLLTLARVWLANGETEQALALLTTQLEVALSAGQQSIVLEIYLLQALALYPRPEAFGLLEKVVAQAAPENNLRLFLDEGRPALKLLQEALPLLKNSEFVDKLLSAFTAKSIEAPASPTTETIKPAKLPASSLIDEQFEPLSEREKEVLRYLAQGLSNRALADKLIVTENTVKVHLRNIFSKLDVNNRTQALARAKELGLF